MQSEWSTKKYMLPLNTHLGGFLPGHGAGILVGRDNWCSCIHTRKDFQELYD